MRVKDVQDIARRLGFYNVEVMEDPWLPYHPEAYAERTPEGYDVIWISSGLLDLSEDAVTVVVAHEIGHIENGHTMLTGFGGSREEVRSLEFEADKFAKKILRKLHWGNRRMNKAFKESLGMTQETWDGMSTEYPTWKEMCDHWEKI
jgi:Zn-dependent protease with chaperone function